MERYKSSILKPVTPPCSRVRRALKTVFFTILILLVLLAILITYLSNGLLPY